MVERNSLPRSVSLKNRTEIDALFAGGLRFPTDFFTLVWQPADSFRYGVFVSKRLGKANRRNRLKRRFREAIRLSRAQLGQPGRIALLPRRVGQEPKLDRLIADLTRVFEQLNQQ